MIPYSGNPRGTGGYVIVDDIVAVVIFEGDFAHGDFLPHGDLLRRFRAAPFQTAVQL